MSALPMNTAGSPSLWNANARECSRYRPTTLRTRMVSLTPSMPGLSEQMPRTQTSIGTPAWLAR